MLLVLSKLQATLIRVATVKTQASLALALIALRVIEPAHARHSKSKLLLCPRLPAAFSFDL